MEQELRPQDQDLIFALDIGTRSIIGVVGRVEDERFRVLAIDKEEHSKRAMLDGQIEDIGQVAKVVSSVTHALEVKLGCRLSRVCIAAAGRALHTERGRFELSLPSSRRIDDDLISQLEAGAVSEAEAALSRAGGEQGQFFLVGYTVSRYQLDHYPLSTLRDHNGQCLEAEVVATFLPGEVVESLYSAMRLAGLEVASLTLEPIAALNAAIPAELRLLNLVLADIGAGTSDIAACRDGSVVGYTMATVAGDEVTETVMRALLVDFRTAERLKADMGRGEELSFTDVLGLEQHVTSEEVYAVVEPQAGVLAKELARCIIEVNGGPPSALFLAGGGSKLSGLRELMARALDMDPRRVAVAGNNFKITAFSEDLDINDPEYATPLGIAVSAGLGLINDSYRVTLNGQPAKLFRSGALTALDVLLMNGYVYADLIGRTGQTLSVILDGQRRLFRGEPAVPSVLRVNGVEVPPSTLIQTGDAIEFTPAQPGRPAHRTLGEVVGEDESEEALVNLEPADSNYLLQPGDTILTKALKRPVPELEEPVPMQQPENAAAPVQAAPPPPQSAPESPPAVGRVIFLNEQPLALPSKRDGAPYYLMDLLAYSGIDFEHLERRVVLRINGVDGQFTQEINDGDSVVIQYEG